ncbi:MAG: MmgE/PrpD family protein [Deltaproteobacteria bacterium]|nr:MmgE/PrpD family protein [Deltaproteobacteria bacterium]
MTLNNATAKNKLNATIVARFVLNAKFRRLPEAAVQMVKRCLLDFIGVALASGHIPAVKSGFGLLDALGTSEDATIVGCDLRTSVIGAVWANSMLGSALDFEDGYYPSVGHPASVIFPVTLAIAEREDKTPAEFLTASIIGYEVCARSGMLMTRTYREKPRGSGGSSVYGAAAAAARLLDLNRRGIEMALGIAGAYMTAIPVLKSHAHEAMVKGGIPWGAVSGTAAAFLARRGFTAPPATLQDPFSPDNDENAPMVLESLGQEYEIINVYFKRYPSCRWTHAPLDAAADIMHKHDIVAERIKAIRVETFKEALVLDLRRPSSLEGVQFSIPFTMALLLAKGEFGAGQMSLEYLQDPFIQRIADKVRLEIDPALDQMFPERRPARVTITTTEGRSFSKEITEVHGEPGSDFAAEGVKDKFFNLATGRLGDSRAKKLYETINSLEYFSSLEPLIKLLKT